MHDVSDAKVGKGFLWCMLHKLKILTDGFIYLFKEDP